MSALRNKLLIEQTKSRPRHSQDHGLAQSKNGWGIRKHIGYGPLASVHAEAFEPFYREHFHPYLNYHRPCGVPEIQTAANGKSRRIYRWYATPWEILRQLPGVAGYLKEHLTVSQLAQLANAKSDLQAAAEMQAAKPKLFASLQGKKVA